MAAPRRRGGELADAEFEGDDEAAGEGSGGGGRPRGEGRWLEEIGRGG
jgi:hypothetical protein